MESWCGDLGAMRRELFPFTWAEVGPAPPPPGCLHTVPKGRVRRGHTRFSLPISRLRLRLAEGCVAPGSEMGLLEVVWPQGGEECGVGRW